MPRAPRAFAGKVFVPADIDGLRDTLGMERHHSTAECLLLATTKAQGVDRLGGLGIRRPEIRLAGSWTVRLRLEEAGLMGEDPLMFYAAQMDRPIVRLLPDSTTRVVGHWRYERALGGRGLYVEPC